MATSMAAAIAASLPAPQAAAPIIEKPTYEAIPASMSKVVDIEADIPVTSVQIDALVVSKILKHGRETHFGTGILLGLDFDGTMEVSNSFPLPAFADEDDRGAKTAAQQRYTKTMVNALKEVQGDENVVGFYQTTSVPFRQSLVETQAAEYEKLRHGGIIIIHDPTQASRGITSLKAYRLTSNFLNAHKSKKFTTTGLIENGLTFSSILEELPLVLRTSSLASAFLALCATPSVSATRASTFSPTSSYTKPAAPLSPDYNSLELALPTALSKNLEHVIDTLDTFRTEENNVAFMTRQIAREKAKADAHLARRKEDNILRTAQGLPPLPEEDISRLFKIPPEPSRLDSMLLLAQLDAGAKNIEDITSAGLVKLYAANPNL